MLYGLSLYVCVCVTGVFDRCVCLSSLQEGSEKNVRIKPESNRRRNVGDRVDDDDSSMSTSSNLEPFANDDLGRGRPHTRTCVHVPSIHIMCFA